jgi:hypothetical protein
MFRLLEVPASCLFFIAESHMYQYSWPSSERRWPACIVGIAGIVHVATALAVGSASIGDALYVTYSGY